MLHDARLHQHMVGNVEAETHPAMLVGVMAPQDRVAPCLAKAQQPDTLMRLFFRQAKGFALELVGEIGPNKLEWVVQVREPGLPPRLGRDNCTVSSESRATSSWLLPRQP